MRIFDISLPIHKHMPVYKNKAEKRPQIIQTRSLGQGGRESRFSLDSHTGTHIDAPSHILTNGKTIDQIHVEKFICPCQVVDLRHISGNITKEVVDSLDLRRNHFILFKTKNSVRASTKVFVFVEASGAKALVQRNIAGVGIDALGIERDQAGHPTHKTLLRSGVLILEGLVLKHIQPGLYSLIAIPINLKGGDAAPARACLISL